MRLVTLPTDKAVGRLLAHNILDHSGTKVFKKGHRLRENDIVKLQALGYREIYCADLEPEDIHEDEAAMRLARAVAGHGVIIGSATTGRVNLTAEETGVVAVNVPALERINGVAGLTVATRRTHTMIQAGKIVATIKIIPFAVVERHLRAAEAVAREARGVVSVRPLKSIAAALILTGGPAGKAKTIAAFEPAIRSRLEALGATLLKPTYYIAEDREEIAHTLRQAVRQGAGLVIIAGETSIMDINDITPQGIVQAGGRVEHYGAPVEPGNLLLLAYLGDVPVIGAPGCARSKSTNIMDLILPRLLTGERLTRKDIIALGNGGLL